jgi:hypothetical protein
VMERLAKQGKLGPVARLLPTTAATTLQDDRVTAKRNPEQEDKSWLWPSRKVPVSVSCTPFRRI